MGLKDFIHQYLNDLCTNQNINGLENIQEDISNTLEQKRGETTTRFDITITASTHHYTTVAYVAEYSVNPLNPYSA